MSTTPGSHHNVVANSSELSECNIRNAEALCSPHMEKKHIRPILEHLVSRDEMKALNMSKEEAKRGEALVQTYRRLSKLSLHSSEPSSRHDSVISGSSSQFRLSIVSPTESDAARVISQKLAEVAEATAVYYCGQCDMVCKRESDVEKHIDAELGMRIEYRCLVKKCGQPHMKTSNAAEKHKGKHGANGPGYDAVVAPTKKYFSSPHFVWLFKASELNLYKAHLKDQNWQKYATDITTSTIRMLGLLQQDDIKAALEIEQTCQLGQPIDFWEQWQWPEDEETKFLRSVLEYGVSPDAPGKYAWEGSHQEFVRRVLRASDKGANAMIAALQGFAKDLDPRPQDEVSYDQEILYDQEIGGPDQLPNDVDPQLSNEPGHACGNSEQAHDQHEHHYAPGSKRKRSTFTGAYEDGPSYGVKITALDPVSSPPQPFDAYAARVANQIHVSTDHDMFFHEPRAETI